MEKHKKRNNRTNLKVTIFSEKKRNGFNSE